MGLELRYFVLKPRAKAYDDVFAYASQMAMRCFSDFIEPVEPELATDLRKWADKEQTDQNKMIETEQPVISSFEEIVGVALAKACTLLDNGIDPREYEAPEFLADCRDVFHHKP